MDARTAVPPAPVAGEAFGVPADVAVGAVEVPEVPTGAAPVAAQVMFRPGRSWRPTTRPKGRRCGCRQRTAGGSGSRGRGLLLPNRLEPNDGRGRRKFVGVGVHLERDLDGGDTANVGLVDVVSLTCMRSIRQQC